MARDGLLHVGRGGRIALTSKGRKVVEDLAMRHQLAKILLTAVIGRDRTCAHGEAERLEHGISPEVEKLLLARFGSNGRCPHGVPLPGRLANLRRRHGATTLSNTVPGASVNILCV